jgi:hypothetical protein
MQCYGFEPGASRAGVIDQYAVFLAAATQPYGKAIWAGLFAFVGMATLISTGVITSKMLATSYAASWWIAGPLLPLLLLPAVYNFISLVTSLKKSNNASAADRHEL